MGWTFARTVRVGVALLTLGCAVADPSAATAQHLGQADREVSPLLPSDHWAVLAVRRAEALGLVQSHLPAQRSVPRNRVAVLLGEAGANAAERAPHLRPLTDGWAQRFTTEFPVGGGAGEHAGVVGLGQRAGGEAGAFMGRVAPGSGVFEIDRTGAAAVADQVELAGAALLAVGVGRHLAVLAEPAVGTSGAELRGWEVAAGWGGVRASVGEQPVAYGYAESGGLVLSGGEPLRRLDVETVEPFRLPWLLNRLGSISVHGFMSRLSEPRHPGDPYMWGASGTLQPHPRLTLSLHRASIIGGDSVAVPVTPRTFFWTFIGHNLLGFENEVVAGQVRLRLPTEALLPVTVYTEWGAEDAAGAWRDVPGRLYGVFVPALPRLPQASLGAEYVSFAPSCCGNPPWYRHAQHRGGWTMDERPLGHGLGGHGSQVTLYSHADALDARVRVDAQVFSRRREGENLFVPGRGGRSTGARVRAGLRALPGGDVVVDLFREAGDGWRESAATVGFHAFF